MTRRLLWSLVGGTFLARAIALWWTRPEFTGWFNHTYYYWVQARGVLEAGTLPYTDLPLLFYLYAALAWILQLFGLSLEPSIINASRLVMCVVPALLVYAAYHGVRRIYGAQPLGVWAWILIALAGFLPLTFAHMPELLQKNMLGMLLLAAFMVAVFTRRAVLGALLFAAIALMHFGTLAVAMMFVFAWIAAVIVVCRNQRQALVLVGAGLGVVVVALLILTLLHDDAVLRLAEFARNSIGQSILSAGLLPALFGTLIPLVLIVLMLRVWRASQAALDAPNRVFWLANILFAAALVAPVYSLDVAPRLVLFLPLPLLFVLAYQLRYGQLQRLHRGLVAAAAAGCLLMVVGETVSLIMMYPDRAEIHAELVELREDHALTHDDLVITEYGVHAIANWFLGTRASLITSVHRDDFDDKTRVFLLAPLTGAAPNFDEAADRVLFETRAERYQATRQRVQVPASVPTLGAHETLAFYQLDGPPDSWIFDDTGRWIGYRLSD